MSDETVTCNGCMGKGWVDSVTKGAQLCPVCSGKGKKSHDVGQEKKEVKPFIRPYDPFKPYEAPPYNPWRARWGRIQYSSDPHGLYSQTCPK